MKKLQAALLLAAALLLSENMYAQKHATGLEFDDATYQNTDRLSPALKFTSRDLPVFSLRKYCPTPGDQGEMGSCVGWATGYAALTITMAIADSINSKDVITAMARSPLYIYNQIKTHGCDPGGSRFNDALNLLKAKGDCKKSDFDPNDCNPQPTDKENTKAAGYKVKEFYNIFGISDNPDAKVAATITSLNAKKPVVAGINLTASFDNVDNTGVWSPTPDEKLQGGHAVCVIGYDNMLKRFEILNSYGVGWGNKGFFTMSYADFGKYCKYGYQIVLEKGVESSGNTAAPKTVLSGTFNFKKFAGYDADKDVYNFNSVSPQLLNKYYTLPEGSVKKDDFYRIVASGMQKDNYVYIFSIKPDNSAEIIFPLSLSQEGSDVRDIAIVPDNNASVEIPVDPKRGLSTDLVGADYLCILYSSKKLDDIKTIVSTVNSTPGDFNTRLQQALGSRLIPLNKITYSNNVMGFTAPGDAGTVAPIVLRVNVIQ
jgi:hypothetical protein